MVRAERSTGMTLGLAAYRKQGLPLGASRWERVGSAMHPEQSGNATVDGRKVEHY